MTFTEAALEVLRSVGKPLHYKKITELAIERNLLSHIGKSPEVTMSSRLATMVKKDRGDAPIQKVKPGVFAARDLGPTKKAAAPTAGSAKEISMSDTTTEETETVATATDTPPPAPPKNELPGGDVFPEEDDDNDPILAGLEEEDQSSSEGGRRRRRRRRRGGKGDGGEGAEQPEGASVSPPAPAQARERPDHRERNGERLKERGDRPGRDRDRPRDRDRDRDRDRPAPRDAGPPLDWTRQPADGDLLGRDLADATWLVLSGGERSSATFVRVAEMLVRRGRLSGNPAGLAPTIAAAVRADNSRSELADVRPRFRIRQGRLALTDWSLPRDVVQAEEAVLRAGERQRDQVRRALIRKLSDLPAAGFAEILATWLNAEGVVSLRAIRRPNSSASEFHFAGTLKRGAEETRLAIVVKRDGRDIEREQLVDVRGSLHHYGNANAAWLVTTGRIASGAREEMAVQSAAPCAAFDGMTLAQAMEKVGIGLQQHVVRVTSLDMDLFEALGDTSEARMDRESEARPEREPREGREAREPREGREGREAREPREPREPRAPREGGEERRPRGRRSNPPPAAEATGATGGAEEANGSSEESSEEDLRPTDVRELARVAAAESDSEADERPTPVPGEALEPADEFSGDDDANADDDANDDNDADSDDD